MFREGDGSAEACVHTGIGGAVSFPAGDLRVVMHLRCQVTEFTNSSGVVCCGAALIRPHPAVTVQVDGNSDDGRNRQGDNNLRVAASPDG